MYIRFNSKPSVAKSQARFVSSSDAFQTLQPKLLKIPKFARNGETVSSFTCKAMVGQTVVQGATAAYSKEMERLSAKESLLLAVEVEFENGSFFTFPAEYLRIYSPAADSKMRTIGGEKVIYGQRIVGIMSVEPVGNYGARLLFENLHKTGICTWDYFYHLGSNKFTIMRNYIRTLQKHRLSRDPPRTKS